MLETLKAGRWPIVELFVDSSTPQPEIEDAQRLVEPHDIDLETVDSERLTQLCQSYEHQGFVARMGEFPCDDIQSLAIAARQAVLDAKADHANSEFAALPPVFAMCDRIQDAHNFGAILRCCDAMNLKGIVIGDRYQSAITPHVARSSAGAVNHLNIYRVPQLNEAVALLKQEEYQMIAATEKAGSRLWDAELTRPMVILIGSETSGIAEDLLSLCDLQVRIPMLGGVNSLNAAVAAGIVLYECRRQQTTQKNELRGW